MSDPAEINDRLEAAAIKAEGGAEIIKQFANAGAGVYIPTESGPLPSIFEWLRLNADALGGVPAIQQFLLDIQNKLDPQKGSAMLVHRARSLSAHLTERSSLLDFGFSSDNSPADNDLAYRRAIAASNNLWLPYSAYPYHATYLPLRGNLYVGGDKGAVILQDAMPEVLTLDGGIPTKQRGLFHVDSMSESSTIERIVLEGFELMGKVNTLGFREHAHLISLNGVRNVELRSLKLTGYQGDGVYIGVGNADGSKRHNYDVYMDKVQLDGVNGDNRNGVSVVDGRNIHFHFGSVRRSTRADMPGAFDIEPMSKDDACRDIYVSHSEFENVGGTSGVLCYYADHQGVGPTKFVVPSNNIRFTHNTLRNCTNRNGAFGANVATLTPSSTSPPLDLEFSFNRAFNMAAIGVVTGCRGLKHHKNEYTDTDLGLFLGLQSIEKNYDIESTLNTYERVGKGSAAAAGYALQVSSNSKLRIDGEKFVDVGKADGTFGAPIYFVDGTSDNVTIKNIDIVNNLGRTTFAIRKLPTHTFNAVGNRFSLNKIGSLANQFVWQPEDYYSYTSATALASMPIGDTKSKYTADATAPGPVKDGMYEAKIYLDPATLSIAQASIMYAYPATKTSPTTDNGAYYFRKPDPSVGGWGGWQRVAGTAV